MPTKKSSLKDLTTHFDTIGLRTLGLILSILGSLVILCLFLELHSRGIPDREWTWIGMLGLIKELGTVHALIIASPVAYVLWSFRTIDTAANLRSSELDLHFNNFSHAAGMLKDIDNILAIETGVALLIKLSEQTDLYDDDIRVVFSNLLRTPLPEYQDVKDKKVDFEDFLPHKKATTRRYAQVIFAWFNKKKLDFISPFNPRYAFANQRFDLENEDTLEALREYLHVTCPASGKDNLIPIKLAYHEGLASDRRHLLDSFWLASYAPKESHLLLRFGDREATPHGGSLEALCPVHRKDQTYDPELFHEGKLKALGLKLVKPAL